MKINKYIIGLSLSIAMIAASCSKVIDVTPVFTKDGSAIFTTLDDYEQALTGTYALFRTTGYYGNGAQTAGAWSTMPDMNSDNLVQTTEDLSNFTTQTNWNYLSTDGNIAISWLAAYGIIAEANLVIRNIDQFSGTNAGRVNRIKGQALAIRSMVHFDLLRYFGVDFDRNSTSLGVPYVTTVDIEAKPKRLTVKETYDNILADATAAETALGTVDKAINTASSKSYIDQVVVRALLARVYLYAKDYVNAEAYASLVITAVPLATTATFPAIWKDASVADVIWSVSINAGETSPAVDVYTASTNRNRYRPSILFMNLFSTAEKTNDIRYTTFVASRATGTTAPYITDPTSTVRKIVYKHLGRGTATDNLVNWKAFRTGEMYLIRAEARALQGGAKEALGLADLNALRAARITGYVPVVLTGTALTDAIATERRKELFVEGHRWFDLKRTTRTIARTECVGLVTGVLATGCNLPATAKEWVWPIPQGELDANPNMAGQQNPGYN